MCMLVHYHSQTGSMFEKSGRVGQQGACVTGKTPLVVIGSTNRKGSIVLLFGEDC